MERCPGLVTWGKMEEIISFQYQRMMRYNGKWHLEKRIVLPGCVFLSGSNIRMLNGNQQTDVETELHISLTPCEPPFLRDLCQDGILIGISRGVIRNGIPIITSGPLKGRERLVRKIARHKRTAEIEIPFDKETTHVTVGLEIYEKEM